MKKKIFKYIKVMMACLLVASLTLPSYAAVSASDGSAFVTKAEFDAALSDFNARLTTFEAGINSKIDSQVSSYLDRNGIWNGKSQTISDDYRVSGIVGWDLFTFCSSSTSNDGTKWLDMSTTTHEKVMIKEITKSGLLSVNYKIGPISKKGTVMDPHRWFEQGYQSKYGNYILTDYVKAYLNFVEVTGGTSSKEIIRYTSEFLRAEEKFSYSSQTTASWNVNACTVQMSGAYSTVTNAIFFFVAKGSKIKTTVTSDKNTGSAADFTGYFTDEQGTTNGPVKLCIFNIDTNIY